MSEKSAEALRALPTDWLIDGSLLYRLSENGVNCDEINITMADHSRRDPARIEVANVLRAILADRTARAATVHSVAPRRESGALADEAQDFMELMAAWRFADVGETATAAFEAVVAHIDNLLAARPSAAVSVPEDSPVLNWLIKARHCGINIVEQSAYYLMDYYEGAEPDSSPLPEAAKAEPEGYVLAPHYRGYANLGTGQYVLNHSKAGEEMEFIISVATEEEKAGRTVGDERDNASDALLQPEAMAVRIAFSSVAGLEALENQLRKMRIEHGITSPPQAEPVSTAGAVDGLRKLCEQLESERRRVRFTPGTGQNHSYLLAEDVDVYVEEARKALAVTTGAMYECIGKGGQYELIGEASGAGTRNMDSGLMFYRDTVSGLFFFREHDDFNKRMRLAIPPAVTAPDMSEQQGSKLASIREQELQAEVTALKTELLAVRYANKTPIAPDMSARTKELEVELARCAIWIENIKPEELNLWRDTKVADIRRALRSQPPAPQVSAQPAADLVTAIKALRCTNPYPEDRCRLFNEGYAVARQEAADLAAAAYRESASRVLEVLENCLKEKE